MRDYIEMHGEAQASWTTAMETTSEDDFSNFLGIDDLHLNYPSFEPSPEAPNDGSGIQGGAGMHNGMVGMDMMEHQGMIAQEVDHVEMQLPMDDMQGMNNMGYGMEAQQVPPQQQQYTNMPQYNVAHNEQPQYRPNNRVPPTPESMKMHGSHNQQQQQQQEQYPIDPTTVYQSYARKQQESMAFTPLASPAVTPYDTQHKVPGFAIPGEYFSPLSSPAMHAQNRARMTAYESASSTASPVDLNSDVPALDANLRKTKRKSGTSTRPVGRVVRESPAMKPQRKKAASSGTIPTKELLNVVDGASKSASSSSASISPEPLLEEPAQSPSTPRVFQGMPSMRDFGYEQSQQDSDQPRATPTTLMHIANQQAHKNSIPMMPAILTNMGLNMPKLESTGSNQPTPTISAIASPTSATMPSSLDHIPCSLTGTPAMRPTTAKPNSTIISNGVSRGASKKRTSSSQVSPAIRPRISPSIKPLLPDGGQFFPESKYKTNRLTITVAMLSSDATAAHLRTHSNYTNIVSGTLVPGVSYPNELSENLTSKRTSHKFAEQGRRDRLNTAIQEMASLLPAKGGEEKGALSKARTVELATEYIRKLKKELGELKREGEQT
jgi:hypothetical protein